MIRRAIDGGIPSLTLMRNAAAAVYRRILSLGVNLSVPVVVCGSGNNGGDGYALALLMEEAGIPVAVLEERKARKATTAPITLPAVLVHAWTKLELDGATLIVDAMYGFSFRGRPARIRRGAGPPYQCFPRLRSRHRSAQRD